MLPQENFLMFQPLRLFLVASEHLYGESLSVISTGSPIYFKSNVVRMWDVSPTVRSAKLQLIYGLKMSKTAALDTFTVYKVFYFCMYCMYGWWLLSRGGGGGRVTLPASPPPPPPPPKMKPWHGTNAQAGYCLYVDYVSVFCEHVLIMHTSHIIP